MSAAEVTRAAGRGSSLVAKGDAEDFDDYEPTPAEAAAGLPNPATREWNDRMQEGIARILHPWKHSGRIYLFSYNAKPVAFEVKMIKQKAVCETANGSLELGAGPTAASAKASGGATWKHTDYPTALYPMEGLPDGMEGPWRQIVNLVEGCTEALVTMYEAGNPDHVYVRDAPVREKQWVCVYADLPKPAASNV